MTVYLGNRGSIQIRRKSSDPIVGTIETGDVSVSRRRFSLDNHQVQGELISGDQIDLKRTDGKNLNFIAGHDFPDWRGYVFVDQLGGIRLFDDFAQALSGNIETAVRLVTPTDNHPVSIVTRASLYNYLGKISDYEITTERETVSITQLGDQFKQQYEAGLISGQGRINCFFEYRQKRCEENGCPDNTEYAMYLAQLCVRLTQGADFIGRFFVYLPEDVDELQGETASRQAVWYDAECLVTNCTINVSPTEVIESTIEFVTTGQIKLLTGVPPSYLLTESGDLLLQENSIGRLIESVEDGSGRA